MDRPTALQDPLTQDVAAIARIDAVAKILEVVCSTTGMGFSAVARVTEDRWVACAVRDQIAFGLGPRRRAGCQNHDLTHGDPAAPVRVLARSDQGGFELTVANSGEPIPAAKVERLFQPFSGRRRGRNRRGRGRRGWAWACSSPRKSPAPTAPPSRSLRGPRKPALLSGCRTGPEMR